MNLPVPMAQSDARPTGDQNVAGSIPAGSGNIFFVEFDHKIFSMVNLFLLLIREACRMCCGEDVSQVFVNRLED